MSNALVADEPPPPLSELMAAMAKAAERFKSSGFCELGLCPIPGKLGGRIWPDIC